VSFNATQMLVPPKCAACGWRLDFGQRIRCVFGHGGWLCKRSVGPGQNRASALIVTLRRARR